MGQREVDGGGVVWCRCRCGSWTEYYLELVYKESLPQGLIPPCVSSDKLHDQMDLKIWRYDDIVKLRQGSGKDRQGMALKAKGLKA